MRAQAVLLMALLLPLIAEADGERLGVVVREGVHDATIVARLRGQLADLEGVAMESYPTGDSIEPTLDGQLAAAERIGAANDARVVVWFVARGKKLAVAIATPRDHRLFVREIPPAAESAMAEAAAIAVRSAVRSIALGGTIGVEVKAAPVEERAEPIPVPVPIAKGAAPVAIDAALGWQVALDGGAQHGAHALVQRTTITRGPWGASLALELGVPLEWRAGTDVALDVSRSGALLGGERRVAGGVAFGVGAGALVYHRSTSTAPVGLAATPSKSTVAFASAVEVAWHARIAGRIGVVACAGVDLVLGAPEAAVSRAAMIEVVDTIRPVQPRLSLAVEVGSW
ncbi:MAG TPA: hypothetical protein VFV99_09295 [Kofleriaceae bacterium]|nr:hypothetical protein [Kofleriaceae bacterium]